jgi:hypothetical protein
MSGGIIHGNAIETATSQNGDKTKTTKRRSKQQRLCKILNGPMRGQRRKTNLQRRFAALRLKTADDSSTLQTLKPDALQRTEET